MKPSKAEIGIDEMKTTSGSGVGNAPMRTSAMESTQYSVKSTLPGLAHCEHTRR